MGISLFRHEFYPICLTCFSVMEERPHTDDTEATYYCPKCHLFKGPVEVGSGSI